MHIFQQKIDLHKTNYPKSYFYSASKKLSLYKASNLVDSKIIDISKFEKDQYLGTLDIANQIAGFDQDDISRITIEPSNSKAKLIQQKLKQKSLSTFNLIKKSTQLTPFPKIQINNFTFKSKNSSGAIQDNQISKTINIIITREKLVKWKKSLKVYFSNKLTTEEKTDLIKSKLSITSDDIHNIGHLSTFMVESEFYYDSKNQLFDSAKPLKILGFCYPDFRYRTTKEDGSYSFWAEPQLGKFWKITTDETDAGHNVYSIDEEVLKIQIFHTLQINLLAVIEEAIKTKNKLPFIINIPSAFLANLEDDQKYLIKKTIAKTFVSLKKIYSLSIFEHISEFIVVAPDAWDSEVVRVKGAESITEIFKNPSDYHTATHLVDADILDIAKKLYDQRGIICPVPIMLNPSYPIGCQYLEPDLDITAFDEMLGRNTGGVPRAIYENGVVKIDKSKKTVLKEVENDPVFITFKTSNFNKEKIIEDDGTEKFFYVDKKAIIDNEKNQKPNPRQVDNNKILISDEIKQNTLQHSFTYDESKNKFKVPEIIDTVPIFTGAIKEAVQDLDCFNDFETDIPKGKNLFYILTFANLRQGVGNKIDELKQFLIDKKLMTSESPDLLKLINQAKILSARFQKKMSDQGIMTGRYQPANIVGARLHRMATKENILQIMQGTTYNERSTDLNLKFEQLKNNFKESATEAQAEEVPANRTPSPSPAPAGSSGRRLWANMKSVLGGAMRIVVSRSAGGSTSGPPPQ